MNFEEKQLLDADASGQLSSVLLQFLYNQAPICCAPSLAPQPLAETAAVADHVGHPLEAFLIGCRDLSSYETIQATLHSLLNEEGRCILSSQMCGRLIRSGDPCYSCRECGSDDTCVLCKDCFLLSEHQNHAYRVHLSSGGGYCDCGDSEAWRAHVGCSNHRLSSGGDLDQESVELVAALPEQLAERGRRLLSNVLHFVGQLLLWPVHRPLSDNEDDVAAVLFNNEHHTYQDVIQGLERVLRCSKDQASDFATIVDREGRSAVLLGPRESVRKTCSSIAAHFQSYTHKPMRCEVVDCRLLARQSLAQQLCGWMVNLTGRHAQLRALLASLLLNAPSVHNDEDDMELETAIVGSGGGVGLLCQLMAADASLWKGARAALRHLYMASVMMLVDTRRQFSVLFTRLYGLLYRRHITDTHNLADSLLSFGVQVFSVQSVSRFLIAEERLIERLLAPLLQQCRQITLNPNGSLRLTADRTKFSPWNRVATVLHDLRYVLRSGLNNSVVSEKLAEGLLNGLREGFLIVLGYLQDADPAVRQLYEHLPQEPEWEGAFKLQLKLQESLQLFVEFAASEPEQLLPKAINTALSVVKLRVPDAEASQQFESVQLGNLTVQARIGQLSSGSESVSVHQPLVRLLTALHGALLATGRPSILTVEDARFLFESCCKVWALTAQVQSNMWRRNGAALAHQVGLLSKSFCRSEMADRDLQLMHQLAALLPPDDFLMRLLHRFELVFWVKRSVKQVREQLKQSMSVAEHLLQLLLMIVGERWRPGVGVAITERDSFRHEVIHLLALGSQNRSDILEQLPFDVYNRREQLLDEMLDSVGHFVPVPTSLPGRRGHYELKAEFKHQFNPFFHHYSLSEQSKARESQLKQRQQQHHHHQSPIMPLWLSALPPPCPPLFTDNYKPVAHLLLCDTFFQLLDTVLRGAVQSETQNIWTEAQLERVFHLIGLGLYEDRIRMAASDHDWQFSFLNRLQNGSVIAALETLPREHMTHDSVRELHNWLLHEIHQVQLLQRHDEVSVEMEVVTPQVMTQSSIEDGKEKKRKAGALAAARRQKIMAKMSLMQRNFIKGNPDFHQATEEVETDDPCSSSFAGKSVEPVERQSLVALGSRRIFSTPTADQVDPVVGEATCILCQEAAAAAGPSGRVAGLLCHVQRSLVLQHGIDSENATSAGYKCFVSSCGHLTHADCFQPYLERWHTYPANRLQVEVPCPLCQALCTAVLPLPPSISLLTARQSQRVAGVQMYMQDYVAALRFTIQRSFSDDGMLELQCGLNTVRGALSSTISSALDQLFVAHYSAPLGLFGTGEVHREGLKTLLEKLVATVLQVTRRDEDDREWPSLWKALAYTLQVHEQILRAGGLTSAEMFGEAQMRHRWTISALVRSAACAATLRPCLQLRRAALRLLRLLLMPGTAILQFDLVECLVLLTLAQPCLYLTEDAEPPRAHILPVCGSAEHCLLQLLLAAHFTQLLLTLPQSSSESEASVLPAVEGSFADTLLKLRVAAGLLQSPQINAENLQQELCRRALPFLRCAALFFWALSDIAPPLFSGSITDDFEYKELASYLDLPEVEQLINNANELLSVWLLEPKLETLLNDKEKMNIIVQPATIPHLIELPNEYSQLLNRQADFCCPRSINDEARYPALCLVCGVTVCSQSFCCQRQEEGIRWRLGAANAHALHCGAGTGLFLRLRECQLLLLDVVRRRGIFIDAPYVDRFGETDPLLRRGYPLQLDLDAYRRLEHLWLRHGVPSEIASQLELDRHMLDWADL